MIEQELILLGLLIDSPKHGYEIKKTIKDMLVLFTGIEIKSIYYPLRILEKKGLVLKRAAKAGKRPERFVYELTLKGEARFRDLLSKSFLSFKRPQFSLDVSLFFLQHLDPEIAQRRLRTRLVLLDRLAKSLTQTIDSFKTQRPSSPIAILEHDLQMIQAESRFLSGLTHTIA